MSPSLRRERGSAGRRMPSCCSFQPAFSQTPIEVLLQATRRVGAATRCSDLFGVRLVYA